MDGFDVFCRRNIVCRPRPPPKEAPRTALPFSAPVRAWALAEWALVPLRLFLGVTFLYAGLQKLANPTFFNNKAPNSIQAQLLGSLARARSTRCLSHLVHFANPIGMVIAFAEVAIGVGVLLGPLDEGRRHWRRLLSFNLFLTVSFHSSPYFTGADIVFFFAWMPFIVAGGGTRLSLDAWIANRRARRGRRAVTRLVAIPFAKVQQICGNFSSTCAAREGLACDAAVCPVLLGDRAPIVTRVADRLGRSAHARPRCGAYRRGGVGAAARPLGGVDRRGRPVDRRRTTPTTTTSVTRAAPVLRRPTTRLRRRHHDQRRRPRRSPQIGTLLGTASACRSAKPATFTVPSSGDPGIVIQSAAATTSPTTRSVRTLGCTVASRRRTTCMVCPCHGSQFQVNDGASSTVRRRTVSTKLDVVEGSDGNLYLQ